MIQTVETDMLDGKVSRVVDIGESGKVGLTIEVYGQKIAFRVELNDPNPPRIGDWLTFHGSMIVEKGKDPVYYHDPDDGSDRKEWKFYEIRDFHFFRVPPPQVSQALRDVKKTVLAALGNWDESEHALSTLESNLSVSLAAVRDLIRKQKETRKGHVTLVTFGPLTLCLGRVWTWPSGTRQESPRLTGSSSLSPLDRAHYSFS